MSGRNDLELDAILAEFHAEEAKAPARPVPAPAERPRRRAEIHAAENTIPPAPATRRESAAEAAAVTAEVTAAVAVAERPARQPAARPEPREAHPPQPAPRPAVREERAPLREPRPEAREGRAARRRQTGLKRMLLALAALAVLLTGLLIWVKHDEKQAVSEETEIVSLDLGQALEEYLDEAPTRTRG